MNINMTIPYGKIDNQYAKLPSGKGRFHVAT